MTLASRTITSKGFLTTFTLPREEALQTESSDSPGRFPDSFPRATRQEGSDPRRGDRHRLEEAQESLGRASWRSAVSLFGLLGSMTLSSSLIKPSLGAESL
ncbi:hypothetical protein CRG98_044845 [Punica granatum]|uniref:Uncharacterized protein n=1 Tax=Punica granatum TaxID=22663 RepID=A0A2I0HSU0_PUNGR|nr:hypothetical protein CRG98_044845 [Punica granatum]